MPLLNPTGIRPRNAYGRMKHKQNLESFTRELQVAVNTCLPSYDKPYGQVSVLAFHWENDDMVVEPLERELLRVFRNIYGFNVESFTIPANFNTAPLSLAGKLSNFCMKWGAEDALTICVYSGHAEEADPQGDDYMLGGQVNQITGRIVGPRINWYHMSMVPASTLGDVLYIFDSCFAASTAIHKGPEVLAAASWGDVAASNLQYSFTKMLIEELKVLNGKPSSIAQIYASIHRDAVRNKLERNPVHISEIGKESIILARIPGPKQRKPESYPARKDRIDALDPAEHRVLISVNLQDNLSIPDLEEWKRWLTTQIPRRLLSADIQIEAAFDATSSLLLVTIPVEVWTMLPANEYAYTFISFVKSGDILPRLTQTSASQLAFRPALLRPDNQSLSHRRGQSDGGPSKIDWEKK